MSINELIARGVAPIGQDVPNILAMVQGKQQADRRNALAERSMALDEQAFAANQQAGVQSQKAAEEKAALQRARSAAQWAQRMPKASIQTQLPDAVGFYEKFNGPGSWQAATDEQVQRFAMDMEASIASQLGEGPPEPRQGASQASSIQEYEAAKASGFAGSFLDFQRAKAQAGQVVTPSYSTVQLEDGSYGVFDSRTGTIRPTSQRGPVKGDATGTGLNDRQQSGVNMQREAAIDYAANLTGVPREEVARIYAEQGGEAVAHLMREKGDRFLQGATARVVQRLPFGETIVDAVNSDLKPPAKSGGAGIAMMQNPTGPIANADFQAGEAQFPQPIYPLDVQAEMVKQLLRRADGTQGQSPPPSGGAKPGREAPPAAIEYLRKNPQYKAAFKAKYGYLPEGF